MILVVGHTAYDHISKVPYFPEKNSSIFIKDYKRFRGGGAANVAAAIAKLEKNPSLLTLVGRDFENSEYENHLQEIGVNLESVIYVQEKTANAFIYTDEEENQITYFHWGASESFSEKEPPTNIDQYELVHLAPSDPEFNLKVVEEAKKTSFDPGQDLPVYSSDQLKAVINSTDFLFCNQYELEKIKNKTTWNLEQLKKKVEVLVVTKHEEGSTIYHKNHKTRIPAIETEARDPTGAGDAYRAGFLKSYVEDYSLEKCGKIASTVASFVVEEIGCQTNLPNQKQTKKRFKENFEENY
ncbi:sugar kinase [archaeon SCG-AAA382B04]|nr:sugar kinase [archaeon SCG-AAA382B04]